MPPTSPPRGPRAGLGRALRHRNFRLFFLGQGTSLVGTWMTRVATTWLIYRLTGSAWLLGAVNFAGQAPTFFLAPFAGVLVDRWNRHRVLVVTQALAMVQSMLLAWMAFAGAVTVGRVLALSLVQGLINVFDTPARQALVVHMVDDRGDLANAIALNSSLVNATRLIGPAIAGVIIAAAGEGWCFAIDAASYLAVIASLLAMRLPPRAPAVPRAHVLVDLRDGFRYVRDFAPVRAVLLLIALVSLTAVPYTVLMPIFAQEILGGGPHPLGLLLGAAGLGALGGALWLAARATILGLGRVMVAGGATFGIMLIAFALSPTLWLSLPLLVAGGAGMMVVMASGNTIVQTLVEDHLRGRVMSFYSMAFFGMVPFGSLLAGWLATRLGAPGTVAAGGGATLIAIAIFASRLTSLRLEARPIYR